MGDENESQGRRENDAIPVDQWASKGVSGDRTKHTDARADAPTEQPYGQQADERQRENAERTGRVEEVTGEARSFESREAGAQPTPDADDLQGPAGDPAEGKRPGGSAWPA